MVIEPSERLLNGVLCNEPSERLLNGVLCNRTIGTPFKWCAPPSERLLGGVLRIEPHLGRNAF
jgi:hypothetical protein